MSFQPPISNPNYQALYIHVPFCTSRCLYCDFTTESIDVGDRRIDVHINGLIESIQHACELGQLDAIKTIYIGGGTPSFIGAERLSKLLAALKQAFIKTTIDEYTIEANPESLTTSILDVLANSAVNRISLGVQSFVNDELLALGRIHDSQTAISAAVNALDVVKNVSVDLMCGIPHQSATSFARSLQTTVELGVPHISIYPLTLEEGTPLAAAVATGMITVADDDEQADMLLAANAMLKMSDYEHYEIASYAKTGYQSQHNTAYWTAKPYLGLGRGAVGMCISKGMRYRFSDEEIIEELNTIQQAAEDIMLGFRLLKGVSVSDVLAKSAILPGLIPCLNSLINNGLIEQGASYYKLTEQGWLLGNIVFSRIWDLV